MLFFISFLYSVSVHIYILPTLTERKLKSTTKCMSIARPYFKTLKNVAVLLPLKLPYFNELLYSLNHRKNNKVK